MTTIMVTMMTIIHISIGNFRPVPRLTPGLVTLELLTGRTLAMGTASGNLPAPARLLELLHAIPSAAPSLFDVRGAKVQLTALAALEVIPFMHRAPTAVLKFLFLTAVLMPVTLFPFPPIHLTAIAPLRLVTIRLGIMGLSTLNWLGRSTGMETPMLDRSEEWVSVLIHLHWKPMAMGRVLSPVEVSVRTGMSRATVQLFYSVLMQNAPAFFVTVKSLLLLMATITPAIVIRFTPRKAKLRPKLVLVVMELLLQAKPAMTTPGIGLVTGVELLLCFRDASPALSALLALLIVHVRRGRETMVSVSDSAESNVMTTVTAWRERRPTG